MRLGIDLGGTKIEGAALGGDGAILARRRVATPRGDYAATIAAIVDLVAALESDCSARGTVGIGIPGALSARTGRVKNANSTWLIGEALDQDLARRLGRPVRVDNDANCFALSEAIDGAGRDADTVFGVILGTGCGSGIVVGRRLLIGRHRIAGEWGHNPLPAPGIEDLPLPPCYCGRAGCVETFVSGPGLSRDHHARTGRDRDVAAIVAEAQAGDADARASLDRHAARLARALAGVVNILDPDLIVLGGGLSRLDHLYAVLPDLMAPHVFSDAVDIDVRPPVHGDSGGVRGAAWLWPEAP